MAQREKEKVGRLAPTPQRPPEVETLRILADRIGERAGTLCQMVRYVRYSINSGVFAAFLPSEEGYNEPIDEGTITEDSAAFYLETIHHVIVMLHATTEDVVRTVARIRLPIAGADVLKDIPIARPKGAADGKLKELAQLVPHQGTGVRDLMRHSIDTWLDRQSFNSAEQVAVMLGKISIPLEGVRGQLGTIDRLAAIRHQIAHTGQICDEDLTELLKGPELEHHIRDVYLFAKAIILAATPKEHEKVLVVDMIVQEELNRRRGLDLPNWYGQTER